MKVTLSGTVIVACNLLAQGMTHGLSTSMGVFYGEWKRDFQEQAALISWLATSVLAVLLGTSPLAGALVRTFGVRYGMIAGAILSASGFLAASYAPNITVLFITIPFMSGFGSSMAFSGCLVCVTQNFKRHFTVLNGVASSGCGVGMVVWPLIFQVLVDHYTWRGALMIVGALQLHLIPLALIMTRLSKTNKQGHMKMTKNEQIVTETDLKHNSVVTYAVDASTPCDNGSNDGIVIECGEKPEQSGKSQVIDFKVLDEPDEEIVEQYDEINGVEPNASTQRLTMVHRIGRRASRVGKGVKTSCVQSTGLSLIWENRVFACYLPTALMGGAVYGTYLAHAVTCAVLKGIPRIEAAFLVSVVGLTNMIARATHGLLLNTGHVHQMFLSAFAYGLGAVAVIVAPSTDSYAVMVACAAGVGIASGIYIPLLSVIVRHMVPLHRFPGGIGMVLLSTCIGIMISSTVSGYILDQTNSYQMAFLFAGCIGLIPCILIAINHVVWNYCIIDERWPPKANYLVQKKE
ncbi:monocarboxylate transporter 6 [Strongylocentrotus purpuratus]|uniref:Major facilitator superfamily (MFS) profile domain-containing protein n=1 Tax=Strongylocentrotus purpuratus TaxID=7668 RepID=A0A7M7MZA2_STRPU|nr:monocarboxylate transporter 6 [Strongylocentrotus purpuratus]